MQCWISYQKAKPVLRSRPNPSSSSKLRSLLLWKSCHTHKQHQTISRANSKASYIKAKQYICWSAKDRCRKSKNQNKTCYLNFSRSHGESLSVLLFALPRSFNSQVAYFRIQYERLSLKVSIDRLKFTWVFMLLKAYLGLSVNSPSIFRCYPWWTFVMETSYS